ncbi:MAG TPA: hypothetical protein VHO48_04195, partial [Anaerolineaceae bacterium]|nr:hypothetical protein [Anaerolineaceae bacterium]
GGERNRSPVNVMIEGECHCLDGGAFAAAAFRCHGTGAMIVDMLPEPGTDDDHVLALFKVDGHWGAVAKSNYTGLRFREPVYRTLRELIMSYFDVFFNVNGLKTLRAYTRPVYLKTFDPYAWMTSDSGIDRIEHALKQLRTIPVISPHMVERLAPIDRRSYEAGMFGVNAEGLFQTGDSARP